MENKIISINQIIFALHFRDPVLILLKLVHTNKSRLKVIITGIIA